MGIMRVIHRPCRLLRRLTSPCKSTNSFLGLATVYTDMGDRRALTSSRDMATSPSGCGLLTSWLLPLLLLVSGLLLLLCCCSLLSGAAWLLLLLLLASRPLSRAAQRPQEMDCRAQITVDGTWVPTAKLPLPAPPTHRKGRAQGVRHRYARPRTATVWVPTARALLLDDLSCAARGCWAHADSLQLTCALSDHGAPICDSIAGNGAGGLVQALPHWTLIEEVHGGRATGGTTWTM
jgi:hypothetical protein